MHREGLVRMELRGEGRIKLMTRGLCESRGVRVEEMERLFEVMHVDVMKYEEKDFDVVMEDFITKNWVGGIRFPK